MRTLAMATAVLLVWTLTANAQVTVGVQKALDKPVQLDVKDVPITQIFKKLGEQTGLKFDLPEDTLALLPYGDQTRLNVKIKDMNLREALSQMLCRQGLQWNVQEDVIRIVPKEGLYRLGRRATFEELRQLGILYYAELQPTAKGGAVLKQIRDLTGNSKLNFSFPSGADKDALTQAEAAVKEPIIVSQWLDLVLCKDKGWTWFLRGDELVFIELRAQIERQLQKQVALKEQNANLMNVLLKLANASRVQLKLDPGVMDYLSTDVKENVNLNMSASVAQALEFLQGSTGLLFIHTNDGIRVAASEDLKRKADAATSQPARNRRPFFVRMTMPLPNNGPSVEVFISPDELPPDVVDYIQAEKSKLIEKIRLTMPPKTTTAPSEPATQPAKTDTGNG